MSLKALADRVIARNSQRNQRATDTGKERNFDPVFDDEKLRGPEANWNTMCDPATATEPFNQEAMNVIKCGQAVPVWSDLLGGWLYWVRDEQARRKLLSDGCQVPIYTLGELAVVANMSQDDIRKLHRLKTAFNGTITGV